MNTTSMLNRQRQEEAEQMLEDDNGEGFNATQMMAQVKGYASKGIDSLYPRHVQGQPPEEQNAYGDGSLAYPTAVVCL